MYMLVATLYKDLRTIIIMLYLYSIKVIQVYKHYVGYNIIYVDVFLLHKHVVLWYKNVIIIPIFTRT